MRRIWLSFRCLAVFLVLAASAGAEAQEGQSPGPSLEYRPPRPTLPEPRHPIPVAPLTIFQDTIGTFGISSGAFDRPVDVACDKNGNIFVLDAGNHRVQKFNGFNNFLLEWGSFGSRPGEFKDPRAIALDADEYVYVVDSGNHRIQKFDTTGKFVLSWGSMGSRSGDFKNPVDITFDGTGNNYVLDAGNERVQKFDSAGRFLGEWGRLYGSRGGIFSDLVSLAWSEERFGYLYLFGGTGCIVQQFEPDGTLRKSWSAAVSEGSLCVPSRIEIDNEEDILYILDSGNGFLMRFTRDGNYLAGFRGAARTFQKPGGFSIDPERGQITVADTGNNIVQKFTLR